MGLLKSRHMFVMYYSMLIFFFLRPRSAYIEKMGQKNQELNQEKRWLFFLVGLVFLKSCGTLVCILEQLFVGGHQGFQKIKQSIYFFPSHYDIQEYTRTILKRGLLCHLCHLHPSASVFFVFLYIFLTDFAYIKWKIACISPECFLLYIV